MKWVKCHSGSELHVGFSRDLNVQYKQHISSEMNVLQRCKNKIQTKESLMVGKCLIIMSRRDLHLVVVKHYGFLTSVFLTYKSINMLLTLAHVYFTNL